MLQAVTATVKPKMPSGSRIRPQTMSRQAPTSVKAVFVRSQIPPRQGRAVRVTGASRTQPARQRSASPIRREA